MCRLLALLGAVCATLLLSAPVMAQDPSQPATPSTTGGPPLHGPLRVNGRTYSDIKPVSARFDSPSAAYNITDKNGIDEIYFKDSHGRYYLAYGYWANVDQDVKEGMVGHVGNEMVEITHVNNEMNTYSEAFYSGIDDVKGILKSLVNENFGKLMASVGLGSAALIGRQLLMHPFVEQGLAAGVRAALPVLGTAAMWAGVGSAAAAVAWPLIIKPLLNWLKRVYLDRQSDNANTIAMVTAENAGQLEQPVEIKDRQEATFGQTFTEIVRHVDLGGTTGTAPVGEGNRDGDRGGNRDSNRAANGTGNGNGTGTGNGRTFSGTGPATVTPVVSTATTAPVPVATTSATRGNGQPVLQASAPVLGTRANPDDSDFAQLRYGTPNPRH